jgi:CRISPR system Cascade subunit CasD
VVQPGVLRRDYHTAQQVLRAKAKLKPGKPVAGGDIQETVLSERFYLSDAYFLVGFESDDEQLLSALDEALATPHWPLALGRKAFTPSLPVRYATSAYGSTSATASIVHLPLADALITADDPAWHALPRQRAGEAAKRFCLHRLILEASNSTAVVAAAAAVGIGLATGRSVQYLDVPLSFSPRRFAPRTVTFYSPVSDVSL